MRTFMITTHDAHKHTRPSVRAELQELYGVALESQMRKDEPSVYKSRVNKGKEWKHKKKVTDSQR